MLWGPGPYFCSCLLAGTGCTTLLWGMHKPHHWDHPTCPSCGRRASAGEVGPARALGQAVTLSWRSAYVCKVSDTHALLERRPGLPLPGV